MTAVMANSSDPDRLVTASEISRLAGVKPQAVSNWRKRHKDFPRPAGTAPGGGDLFRLDEIERWLEEFEEGKPRKRSGKPRDQIDRQLWSVAERLRGRTLAGDIGGLVTIAAAFIYVARETGKAPSVVLRGDPDPVHVHGWVDATTQRIEAERPELVGIFRPLRDIEPETLLLLLGAFKDIDARERFVKAVEAVLDRGHRYGDYRTPELVAGLLVDLAQPHGNVLDPAAGSGEFLLQAAKYNARCTLYGQELNEDTWRIAVARLLLHGVRTAVVSGDSFTDDAFPNLRAEVVFCEPPFGERALEPKALPGDSRWRLVDRYDCPPSRASSFAWLTHVIHHLAPDGRGYMLLPTGTLFWRGTEARMRAELLRQGTVEAVATLPGGALNQSKVPAAVWVVRPPTRNPGPVLLIAGDDGPTAEIADVSARILETVQSWRAGQFVPTVGFATEVPVLKLLAGDASLEPARWVYEEEVVNARELIKDVHDAERALQEVHRDSPSAAPRVDLQEEAVPRARVRVRDLVELGLATIVRPTRKKAESDKGLRLWLPADIGPSWDRDKQPRFADPTRVDPGSITQPGDIVLTTVGGLRARVDFEGNHVLGTSLQAIRLQRDTFDPVALAALLTSPANRRLMDGVIPRVKVLELEIPRLPLEETRRLADVLNALEREEEAGHNLARRAADVREALVAALVSGAVATRPSSAPSSN